MLTPIEIAKMIDISVVRTHHTMSDIKEIVEYAKQYRFISVHVLPCWVKILSEMLQDVDGVYVGSPVGFPSGGHKTETKILEAKQLIEDGVQEMDIVMNVGRFKNKEYDYVLKELKEIIALADKNILIKVLIEINCLTDYEMEKACELVIESEAGFLKTGTGWVPGNANINKIKRIKEIVKDKVKIKAAGGIRNREEFLKLYDIGVERFGINTKSAIEIVKSFE
ncbi:Deoxyribose-phosphate aldolase [subsurface metagenome]